MNALRAETGGIHARFRLAYPASSKRAFTLDVDLIIPGKGISAIFGHSGCGKTTLLRCIAGLQKAQIGKLCINGNVWQDEHRFLPTHRRPLGYVFQEPSLFAHLTAKGNLNYALKRAGGTRSWDLFHHVVSLMNIESVLHRYPAQLSGGEKQRIGIARALLIRPRLLLMDEPLASLDVARKQEILPYLEKVAQEFDFPILYVSHSIDEVTRLADNLVILDQGRSVAEGALTELMSRVDLPIKLGDEMGVVLEAQITQRHSQWQLLSAKIPGGELLLRDSGETLKQKIRLRILARDISLALESHTQTSILNRLAAEVVEITQNEYDPMALVRLKVGDTVLIARITRRSVVHLQLKIGSAVWAQIKSVAIVR